MPRPRLIDLTRLTSRVGRGALTGIDRVELAWAEHLLQGGGPLFGLVHTRLGYLLLDQTGISALLDRVRGTVALGPNDLAGRLFLRRNTARARCEADLRRLSVARAAGPFLRRILRRIGPSFDYLNLGHTDLKPRTLARIGRAGGLVAVLIHDTIPLDHPDYARPGTVPRFARKIAAAAQHADLLIFSTHAAHIAAKAHFARFGRMPRSIVAPLGITVNRADDTLVPPGIDLDRPFFLALGTIEPRKNLGLLCDVWQAQDDLPPLYIIGNPGWAGQAQFDRLHSTRGIRLLGPLPDGAVAALMDKALALLFPSLAEGYGLPPVEAAARGLAVLCSDLSVLREVLKDFPVYLAPTEVYAWSSQILDLVRSGDGQKVTRSDFDIPGWDAHFNAVLTALADIQRPDAPIASEAIG